MHSDQCCRVSSHIPTVHRRMKIKLDFDATVQLQQIPRSVAPAMQAASYLVRKDRQFT